MEEALMQKRNHGETSEVDNIEDSDHPVHDSSLDDKGNVPRPASTGAWKALLFIMAFEFIQIRIHTRISANLIIYLTTVLHQDLKTAVKNAHYLSGVTTIMTLFGAFLADAYTGRFSMIMLSSVIYVMGLSLLTMSELIPSLKPCNVENCSHPRKVHEAFFFVALLLLSLGTGGQRPCLVSFGADQFDDDHSEERKQKTSFFGWWNFIGCCGFLFGATSIAYVQDQLFGSVGVLYLILTFIMGVAFTVFYLGKPFYRCRAPEGSFLIPMSQVLIAAIIKRSLPHPSDPDLLYETPQTQEIQGRLLCHTNCLRFLDKAAIVEDHDMWRQERKQNAWRLATVTMVEETKLIINMIPILFNALTFGVCLAQATTFFVKQSREMDRKIGSFEIPPGAATSLSSLAMLLGVALYEKILVPVLRRVTGNDRGINVFGRIGIGLIFSVLAMTIAACVEWKRLRMVERELVLGGKAGQSLPMSVLWLAPQCILLGIGESFSLVGLQEYFYEQVPHSMQSLGMAFYFCVIGVGRFISSFIISVVVQITAKFGTSWIGKDVNSSRLDKFYWLRTIISGLNLCIYVFFARRHPYKNIKKNVIVADHLDVGSESMA